MGGHHRPWLQAIPHRADVTVAILDRDSLPVCQASRRAEPGQGTDEMEQLGFVQDLAVVLAIGGAAAWICRRLGVSIVVGYLLAGIVIGPHTPPFSLVRDLDDVHSLANLGLVFVLFFVGLNLGLPRLRRMGATTAIATALTALLLLLGARLIGWAFGWSVTQTLFLAGVVMVSSSAIISSVLRELDATQQPFAQQSLGITVLEDLVAVVNLAVLGALGVEAAGTHPLGSLVAQLAGFVLVLLVGGLLVVPRLLARLRRSATMEIQTVCVTGLLLGLAWLAARIGYSLALGAFLLGSIIGSTSHRHRLEQAFEGSRDLFAAVFFISMGMLFELRLAWAAWPMVLGLTAFSLLGRAACASTALVATGQPARLAVQSAVTLLPLGEFSFVIAQLGVASGVMPASFYSATVGAALISTLLGPGLIRRSGPIAELAGRHEPQLLLAWREVLRRAAAALRARREGSPLGRVVLGRILQLCFEMALVLSGLLLASALYERVAAAVVRDPARLAWFPIAYWVCLGLLLLVPLLAIWRNLGTISRLLAEAAVGGDQPRGRVQTLLEHVLRASGALAVLVLCLVFLPQGALQPLILLPFLLVLVALALLLRARLAHWHGRLHAEISERVGGELQPGGRAPGLTALGVRWNLRVHEHELSDLSPAVGSSIRDTSLRKRFGCTIVGIDRQGLTLANPSVEMMLAPGDRLLLVGTDRQIAAAEEWLRQEERVPAQGFSELVTQDVCVPDASPAVGRSLAELALTGRFGVQILALEHEGRVVAIPSGGQKLRAGDSLLVLGTAAQHEAFSSWLLGGPGAEGGEAGEAGG